MTVVDERPCGYCGAKAGEECRGYGLVTGDVHMARIRPELADRRLALAAYDLLQACELGLAELMAANIGAPVRGVMRDAIRKAKEST